MNADYHVIPRLSIFDINHLFLYLAGRLYIILDVFGDC